MIATTRIIDLFESDGGIFCNIQKRRFRYRDIAIRICALRQCNAAAVARGGLGNDVAFLIYKGHNVAFNPLRFKGQTSSVLCVEIVGSAVAVPAVKNVAKANGRFGQKIGLGTGGDGSCEGFYTLACEGDDVGGDFVLRSEGQRHFIRFGFIKFFAVFIIKSQKALAVDGGSIRRFYKVAFFNHIRIDDLAVDIFEGDGVKHLARCGHRCCGGRGCGGRFWGGGCGGRVFVTTRDKANQHQRYRKHTYKKFFHFKVSFTIILFLPIYFTKKGDKKQ